MKREEKRREKKKDVKRLFLFLRMFRILPFFFFNYFHDPNSIFRVEGLISAGVSGGTVSFRTRKLDDRVVSRDWSLREIWCDVFMSRCFSDLQTQQVLGNNFLMETRIICLIKQGSERTCETRTSREISQQLYR